MKTQAQQQQLTPILQTLIEHTALRNNQRHALLDQLTLLQSDKQTDNNSLIRNFYEALDRTRFPLYTINSWTVYYQNYINHNISIYDSYGHRRNALQNQALGNNVHIGAAVGIRPSPPVTEPYERDENKKFPPLCPATNRFLDNSPLENDIPVNASLMEKFLHTGCITVS